MAPHAGDRDGGKGKTMFIGHFAVGFAAKRAAPRTSLGLLMAAACFPDILWPIFLLLGWERVVIDPGNTAFTPLDFLSYPLSHSLVMVVLWAALAGMIYATATGYRRGGWWIGIAVLSHWVLDFVSHRPDMPLLPWGGPKVGLGLWNSVIATVMVESMVFMAGVWIYQESTHPTDRIGRWGYLAFVLALAAAYAANLAGPPPPSVRVLALTALAMSLLFVWPAWFDRHRRVTAPLEVRGMQRG